MIGGRPEIFVAVLTQRTITASEKRFVKPSRPYLAVEFWRHGERPGRHRGMGSTTCCSTGCGKNVPTKFVFNQG
jgi:hypothetical protein